MKHRRKTLPTACGFGLAAVLGLGVLPAVAASPDAETGGAAHTAAAPAKTVHAGYIGEQDRAEDNAEFFRTVMRDVLEKQAASGAAQVTVTYDAGSAPTFSSQIANSAAVWNSAVQNVQLAEGSNASFEYREGNDPRGSYASTDGHGSGYIFLDYAQNEEYDSDRVVAHETGHVLGLPDNYSGPCEELMSGGGPGPSCTNDRPNSAESAQIEQLWANGLAEAALTPHP